MPQICDSTPNVNNSNKNEKHFRRRLLLSAYENSLGYACEIANNKCL